MDVFVVGIPASSTNKQFSKFFRHRLAEFGIQDFHADKKSGKTFGNITVLDIEAGKCFLEEYGVPVKAPLNARPKKRIFWDKPITCKPSTKPVDDHSLRALAMEASQRAAQVQMRAQASTAGSQNKSTTRFEIDGMSCGVWDYSGNDAVFIRHFREQNPGIVSFGINGAIILLGGYNVGACRIDLRYHECQNIVLGTYEDPSVSFTMKCPPKFYEMLPEDPKEEATEGDDNHDSAAVMMSAFKSISLGTDTNVEGQELKKIRIPAVNESHLDRVAGTCFVYRLHLSDLRKLSAVRSLLDRGKKTPATMPVRTRTNLPSEPLKNSFSRLEHDLADERRYGKLPYGIRFQLHRLASNGVIPPLKVQQLLPRIVNILHERGTDATVTAIRKLYNQVPYAGPETAANDLSTESLESLLETGAEAYSKYLGSPLDPFRIVRNHDHINLIHKVVVTPAGYHLEGPEPEPTNRVIRRYKEHTDDFVRVVFQDEDGAPILYDPRASQRRIYHGRFKKVLDGNILIAGKAFSFLGFSRSSLRAQTCWFMAPIYSNGGLKIPELILKELGDFSNIRVPARCAARIGQNFTDTNATGDLRPQNMQIIVPIVRNGYDFSDGVGTISPALLRRVWRVYGTRRLLKPTALQIRLGGSKGMVSVDSRLPGEVICIRDNMNKFEAHGAWNLEICGAAFKPLPLMLNRPLIKILEDLGVQPQVFLNLQNTAIDKLRYLTTTSAVNSANFLEEMNCCRSTRMPSLIRLLNQIGLDYRQDHFLYSVVEMAVVMKLRDIKYRGRIPVPLGHTLYGIMDETGELAEGEVYVVTEAPPEGGRRILVQDGIAITRSPALHPGDVQIVNAVDVSSASPLKELSNVVVFSQYGERDLPNQLSGGDLDGDQYHIIFDKDLIPSKTEAAAAYPRVSAKELDRVVTRKDMSDFFVTFMESDLLGMISTAHLQLTDQRKDGTHDEDCKILAGMASTAVDFSKTGIPVNMKNMPRRSRCRPDFMAPSPRVIVSDKGTLGFVEEENEEEEAFEDLDTEQQPYRYYPSNKVLGELYRNIDEDRLLTKMQRDQESFEDALSSTNGLIFVLLEYMKRQAAQYGVLFDHHHELAKDIRAGYEDNLADILYTYAPSVHMPLSEQEAFAGTILGRKGGAQSKPLRDLGKTMRERFENVVDYTIMRITKGDEQMGAVDDLDILYEESVDREVEALPRAMACLAVAVEEQGYADRQLGELQSFKYIAAGVCLRELERYMLTTLGRYILPTVREV